MPLIPRSPRPTSVLGDRRPVASGSTRTAATRRKRYCIVNHEGQEVELRELGEYGLRIQIEVEDDVPSDAADEDKKGTHERAPSTAQCLELVNSSVSSAPPNTVAFKKVPRRASNTDDAGVGNERDNQEPCDTYLSSPTPAAVKPAPGNAPRTSTSPSVMGDTHLSDPDHQYLANHRVSSYPTLTSPAQEQDDNNLVEPNRAQAESSLLHLTTTEREKHQVPSRPAVPPTQTDSAIEDARTALSDHSKCEDPDEVFVEQLRVSAMAGAQVFNYEGYVSGTHEACIDLTRYVWQSGVNHGLGFASKIGPVNRRHPGHTCGGACEEVQNMRKELHKEKNNVKWEKWNVWEQKEKIKKMTMQHEVHVKRLKDDNEELKEEKEKLKSDKKKLEDDKQKLAREKMEQEGRILRLMEEDRENQTL